MKFVALGSLLLALGCNADDGPPPDGLPLAPPMGEWIEVEPGGDTICSQGTPYRFFVRGGRPDRVIVDFRGGGACWNAGTCALADALFTSEAGTLDGFLDLIGQGIIAGIFDPDPATAFADWTIVHLPYCTGDVHWGDAVVEYRSDVTINHKGFVNASAALDWVYSRYPAPESVFVSGCSAGAYGAILHSAYIANHYADADIAVLADSGSGIITDTFLSESLPNWNAEPNLPPFIPALQVPIAELTLSDFYVAVANHFPEHRFAQTVTSFDADQIFYYEAMGGNAADWPAALRASLTSIETAAPNFRAYVPPGSMHCVTPYPFFHDREVHGTRLSDWTTELVTGAAQPPTVACDGAECCSDPVCDGCVGSTDPWCRFCNNWPPEWSTCATM